MRAIAGTATAWQAAGKAPGRADCSGFVSAVLAHEGLVDAGGARAQWLRAVKEKRVGTGRPPVGALAFFDRTWDSNGNGKVDDTLTHVGVVVGVDADGRVAIADRQGGKIALSYMDLAQPSTHARAGKVRNSFVRSPRYGPHDGPRLTGELFHGWTYPPGR